MSDGLERGLRKQLQGKTLLGEVVFRKSHCDLSAQRFKDVFARYGFEPGIRCIREDHPIEFALWLVNEAFFSFDGGYWPVVIPKLGLRNSQGISGHVGRTFLDILRDEDFHRFRRLNTHWSYLGPILAHCGIPSSRLPQFFERLLPYAAEVGVDSDEGIAQLQQELPSMGLSRSIEWFIRFGEHVSADFLRRAVGLYRMGSSTESLPKAHVFGLPERVVEAFDEWRRATPMRPTHATVGPKFQRPRLVLDPTQGVRLELPSQPCAVSSPYLEWQIRADTGAPLSRRAARFPGDVQTQSDEVHLTAPFSSVIVRLRDVNGADLAVWSLHGMRADRPVLCFGAEDQLLMPFERAGGGLTGLVMPTGSSVSVLREGGDCEAMVAASLGALPFGWSGFSATVFDLGGATAATITAPDATTVRLELREQAAASPTLEGTLNPRLAAQDRSPVFVGDAPSLLVPTNADAFKGLWTIAVRPVAEHATASLSIRLTKGSDLFVEATESNGCRLPLDQPNLLGDTPWGVFEVSVIGPLGEGRNFRFTVIPHINIQHNWSERHSGKAEVQCVVVSDARLSTSEETFPERTPATLEIERERTPLHLDCKGYGGVRWRLPVDLYLPLPSWSVYDPSEAGAMTTWASGPITVALSELDGHTPQLLVRTATPWGVPAAASLRLSYGDATLSSVPARLDAHGHGRIDLKPLLAAARQSGFARTQVRLEFELARVVSLDCAWLERHWSVDNLEVRTVGSEIVVNWSERFAVEGRTLRVYSQFTPWRTSQALQFGLDTRGTWSGSLGLLCQEPGKYLFELGVEDEWSGAYQRAATCLADVGTLADWTSRPLAAEASVDGHLYRALVHAATGWDPPAIGHGDDLQSDEDALAVKALISLQSLVDTRDPVRRSIERLIDRLPVRTLARAIASTEVDANVVLRLGIMAQPRNVGATPPLSADEADTLWRRWGALGAWVDLQSLAASVDAPAVERYLAWLGDSTLRQLGPLTSLSTVSLTSEAGDTTQRQVLEVEAPPEAHAFAVHALRNTINLTVRRDRLATPEHIEVVDGEWWQDEQTHWKAEAKYAASPAAVVAVAPAPEAGVLSLIESGNTTLLRAVEQHCKPYPTSPIGAEAFQQAGFEWAIRVTESPARRSDLEALCREALPLVAEALASHDQDPSSARSHWRIVVELKARLPRLAKERPLSAAHAVSWLVASMMVWRSLGRPALVLCGEQRLVDLSTRLYELAPSLFSHDLMKVCAIEALLAFKAHHGPRPDQPHN